MDINSLTVGEAREIVAMFGKTNQVAERIDHGLQITVLDNGFVYIGRVVTNGNWGDIVNAWNVRRWGTTHGLGQLAEGPLDGTVLDHVGHVRFPMEALQHLIAVRGEGWKEFA